MRLCFFLFLILTEFAANATNQIIYMDSSRQKQRQEDRQYDHISGTALAPSGDKDGQLLFYVRNCGKLALPKNAKGDAPKVGQHITVLMKERCTISDWK